MLLLCFGVTMKCVQSLRMADNCFKSSSTAETLMRLCGPRSLCSRPTDTYTAFSEWPQWGMCPAFCSSCCVSHECSVLTKYHPRPLTRKVSGFCPWSWFPSSGNCSLSRWTQSVISITCKGKFRSVKICCSGRTTGAHGPPGSLPDRTSSADLTFCVFLLLHFAQECVKLTTHIQIAPRLRMHGAMPPPPYVMTWWLVKHRESFTFQATLSVSREGVSPGWSLCSPCS